MSLHRSSTLDIESDGASARNAFSPRTLSSSLQHPISCAVPSPAVGFLLPLSPPLQSRNREYEGDDSKDQDGFFGFVTNESRSRRMSRSSAKSERDVSPSLARRTASETTALLSHDHFADSDIRRTLSTNSGKGGDAHGESLGTTPKTEFLILSRYSVPLVFSCLLQYSLTGASVIAIGHLGKTELAAVSLAIMTSNVTGYCAYSGLATSLDTLCAQAYGSGRPHLVGLHVQRMVYLMWIVSIPIAALWLSGTQILLLLTPDRDCAELAGLYLRILVLGAPGFATFEAGKRFVQAQGLFNANLYVLLFCAPLNAFLNWLFVWRFEWGFVGAPIAVVVTNNCLPLCLWLYVYFIAGRECWGGFSKRALTNWTPMLRLAGAGYVMLVSEFLAFEILTLASSHISTTALAAQSVLSTLSVVTFQIPFPISIASSTRLANLIGAGLPDAGKVCIKITIAMGCCAGLFNIIMLTTLRNEIPLVFTDDPSVIAVIVHTLPIFATFQLFDAVVANCAGILRGMGRQKIGGWVNVICYYGFAIPVSLGAAFGLGWGLIGLWLGPAVGLFLVSSVECMIIYRTNWDKIVDDAYMRNQNDQQG